MYRDRTKRINRSPGVPRFPGGLFIAATLLLLLGLLSDVVGPGIAAAQPVPTGTPVAFIELRVHSCPDDFAGTGFYQHLTQCTSERSLYGVGMGMQAGRFNEPQFQYSQPDDSGRAALMKWVAAPPNPVTITEVAPDPIKPSVAFCSLQPVGAVPLTMDGDAVPVNDGVMTIDLRDGDTLMCDWYRFPGGVTAGDAGDDDAGDDDAGDAGDIVLGQGADQDGDGLFDDDEADVYGTDPANEDTDGDGVSDGEEVYLNTDPLVANEPTDRADTDADGLYDDDETQIYRTDPAKADTDGDGVDDGEEVYLGTDPTMADNGGGNGGDNGGANPGGGNGGGNSGGGDNGGGDGGNGGAVLDANCLDSEEAVVLKQINALRAENNAPPVRVSGTLTKAAEGHSRDMGVRNFTLHTNPDGKTELDRMLAAGYVLGNPFQVAENIFWGDATGQGAFTWWAGSPGHRGNMLDPNLTVIGIARVEVPGSTHGWYWTTTHANQFDTAPDC